MKSKYLILAGLYLLLLSSPGSADRKRITLAPQPGEFSEADIEKEIVFGREMAAIILANRKSITDEALNRYVNLVGQTIARQANRPELFFHFAVIDSPEINAYAMPGGYIFVTTSALKMMQNEAELAGVLAHEIAHITERHIVEALKIRADDDSMIAVVSKVVGSRAETANVLFYQAIDHAFDLLYSKGLAVEDEYKADQQGLYLTAFAGYDASAYHRFLERIGTTVEKNRGELSNTHPPFAERISRLKTIIENEGLEGLENPKNEKRFAQFMPTGG